MRRVPIHARKEKLKTVTFHVQRICKIYFTATWTVRASSPFGNAERPGRAPGHSTLFQTTRAPTAIRREATCTPPKALLPSPTLRLQATSKRRNHVFFNHLNPERLQIMQEKASGPRESPCEGGNFEFSLTSSPHLRQATSMTFPFMMTLMKMPHISW